MTGRTVTDVAVASVVTVGRAAWRILPGPVTRAAAETADAVAAAARQTADRMVRLLGPAIVRAVVEEMDLTELVRDRVDLDAVAAGIDIDLILDRVDVDGVVARADLQRVVDRLDLDAIVARVNLDRVVERVDLDTVVARVDLDRAVGRVNLDAIVGRLDLIGLAYYVVDGIDLPGIIRQSSGSMASEVVRGVRLQGMEADEAVGRLVGRLLPGRRTPPDQRPQPSTP